MTPKDNSKATRLTALRRFATTITILNVVGHIYLGFEQSWAQPLVALATTYSMELLLELIDARTNRRPLAFAGGMRNLVDFLLPAHITGLSIAMLLWANDQLWPFAFAAAVATGSKAILRVPIGKSTRHFLNPSNLGITMTLILLPWVGFAPPYEFTENLTGVGYWILPGLIIVLGTMVNRLTGRCARCRSGWLRLAGVLEKRTVWLAGSSRAATDDGGDVCHLHLLHDHRPGHHAHWKLGAGGLWGRRGCCLWPAHRGARRRGDFHRADPGLCSARAQPFHQSAARTQNAGQSSGAGTDSCKCS